MGLRVAPSTGVRVALGRRTADDWTLTCRRHGTVAHFDSRADAESWQPAPEGWCASRPEAHVRLPMWRERPVENGDTDEP